MASESMPAAVRRRKVSGVMTAVDRNTSHSLQAAKQLYGNTAPATRVRADIFYADRTATKNISPDKTAAHVFPSCDEHHGGKGQLRAIKRRKRSRSDPQKQGDVFDAGVGTSTLSSNKVASKGAPRLSALQVMDNQVPNGIRESPVLSGGAGDPQAPRTENTNDCYTPDTGVPACSSTLKNSACTATVGTTIGTTKPGHSRRKGRGQKSNKAACCKPFGSSHAATIPTIQMPRKLNGMQQRQLNKEMRWLTSGEQERVTCVLKKLAAQIGGKRVRLRELFALVRIIVYSKKQTS